MYISVIQFENLSHRSCMLRTWFLLLETMWMKLVISDNHFICLLTEIQVYSSDSFQKDQEVSL